MVSFVEWAWSACRVGVVSVLSGRGCVAQKVAALEQELNKQQGVNEELSTELREAGSYAELNHTINDLDSQLETAKRAEQQALQRVKELETELDSAKLLEQVRVLNQSARPIGPKPPWCWSRYTHV